MSPLVEKSRELLEATDETIDDALRFADPMVLRGLLYQLTGDETVRATETFESSVAGPRIVSVTDPESLELIRSKAAALMRSMRDAGSGTVPIGPEERLPSSLSLSAGEEIPSSDREMWLEALALDPSARGLDWPEPPVQDRLDSFTVAVIGAGDGRAQRGRPVAAGRYPLLCARDG